MALVTIPKISLLCFWLISPGDRAAAARTPLPQRFLAREACLIGTCTSSASITRMKRRYPRLSEHYTARAHQARGIAPRFPTLSADCPRDLWIGYPFFLHIFLFSIPLTRYARYQPGGEKDTLFTRFYWRGWCTGPNETCPPGGGGGGVIGRRWSFNAELKFWRRLPTFHSPPKIRSVPGRLNYLSHCSSGPQYELICIQPAVRDRAYSFAYSQSTAGDSTLGIN